MQRLRISEIFFSLQGETKTVGIPTVFVRLTGCPLRCQYCDTDYAFSGGTLMTLSEILEKVQTYPTRFVTVTGGEPLAQKACINLLSELCNLGYRVSLETSGAIDVSQVDPRVVKILDIKTPGSQEASKNKWDNFDYLLSHDEIKFVICNEQDYVWSKEVINQYQLNQKCDILFSPSHEELKPDQLADWILRDQLQVRLQIQLHKYLWGNARGK